MPRRLIWRLSSCVRRLYSAYAARLRRATCRLSDGPWQPCYDSRACIPHTCVLQSKEHAVDEQPAKHNTMHMRAWQCKRSEGLFLEMDTCQTMQLCCCMIRQ